MCRSIKKLRTPEALPPDAEIRNAALQFVRKISGYNAPSKANKKSFDRAVDHVAKAARHLLADLADSGQTVK